MRKYEQERREMRYKIEDGFWAEREADAEILVTREVYMLEYERLIGIVRFLSSLL